MSHVIDDATSAMDDTYDETASMPDTTVPLGEFLDEQIARAREKKKLLNLNTMMIVMMKICLLFLKVIFLIWNLLLLF